MGFPSGYHFACLLVLCTVYLVLLLLALLAFALFARVEF